MTTICWDVDTQVDFVHHDGLLAVPDAETIIPNLRALTHWARSNNLRIVATADDHDIGHAEITDAPDWTTTFPPHCMRGTPGQLKIEATRLHDPLVIQPVPLDAAAVTASVQAHRSELLINKPGTDVFRWNPNAATVLAALAPARVVVYGVATDFCVRAAVAGLAQHAPQAELVIVRDAVRAINAGASADLFAAWSAAGHRIVSTREMIG
ncbi:MAG: isochorismatase family protein [Gemmatimonadota bacterium]